VVISDARKGFAPLEEVTAENFNKQFGLNVLGLILTTQEAVRHFGVRGGSVVNISSAVGKLALSGATVYSALKAAVDSITRTLSAELGPCVTFAVVAIRQATWPIVLPFASAGVRASLAHSMLAAESWRFRIIKLSQAPLPPAAGDRPNRPRSV
jgi:NAD(P)-dependent dehydrogenase (short-subunit alcohol dehydrogenase family)